MSQPQQNAFVPIHVPIEKIDETMNAMGVYKQDGKVVMFKKMAMGFIDTLANLIGLDPAQRTGVPENMLFQFLDLLVHQSGLHNDNILKYWLPRWTKNAAANYAVISALLPDHNGEVFALKYDGETCVIPSTGPSLDRNIEELKRVDRSRYRIMAPTSALNPLIANGIQPDFACLNDAQQWVAEWHFKGLEEELKDVPLICMTTAHPDTIDCWPGPIYFYNDYHPDYDFLQKRIFEIYDVMGIPCSGCVSNIAIRLAVIYGFTRLVLLGNDFGFTDGRYCATKYERDGNCWSPVDTRKEIAKIQRVKPKIVLVSCPNKHPVKDARQKKCFDCGERLERLETTGEYLFYLRDMLSLVQQSKQAAVKVGDQTHIRNVEIINCTGGGVPRDVVPGKLEEVFKEEG